jgi:hypothetical protein
MCKGNIAKNTFDVVGAVSRAAEDEGDGGGAGYVAAGPEGRRGCKVDP